MPVISLRTQQMKETEEIVKIVLKHYPEVQGIYLFGSFDTENEWPDSDIDIALLLPPQQAEKENPSAFTPCVSALADYTRKAIDLVNIRRASTVFQREIIAAERLVYCADRYAVDEFEMLALSYYQKLNEERKELMDAFLLTGRAYRV